MAQTDRPRDQGTDRQCQLLSCPGQLKTYPEPSNYCFISISCSKSPVPKICNIIFGLKIPHRLTEWQGHQSELSWRYVNYISVRMSRKTQLLRCQECQRIDKCSVQFLTRKSPWCSDPLIIYLANTFTSLLFLLFHNHRSYGSHRTGDQNRRIEFLDIQNLMTNAYFLVHFLNALSVLASWSLFVRDCLQRERESIS